MGRISKAEANGYALLAIGAAGILLLLLSMLIALLSHPATWVAAGTAAICIGIIKYREYYWKNIWPDKYFSSEEFLEQKAKISSYVEDCNDLNKHISELKALQESVQSSNKGTATLKDSSIYNYRRESWKDDAAGNHVYQCSRTIVTNAKNNPFKYLIKYFKIKQSEETLHDFESMLNDFAAAEEGARLLDLRREEIIASISECIHPRAKKHFPGRLKRELGFERVIFDEVNYPTYTFQYVSAGGNSSAGCEIVFNPEQIEDFIDFLGENIKFKKSVAGQRALMTQALRTSIKERDDYTCQKCGANIYEETNLLLEIDHIIPLSKGGTSIESNLQTLCWRCNRSKGSKIE